MGKQSKVHFLTAYIEYLLDEGIRSEYYYLGDASRFLRFLITRVEDEDVQAFLNASASRMSYERRIKKTLRKFYRFAEERLQVQNETLKNL